MLVDDLAQYQIKQDELVNLGLEESDWMNKLMSVICYSENTEQTPPLEQLKPRRVAGMERKHVARSGGPGFAATTRQPLRKVEKASCCKSVRRRSMSWPAWKHLPTLQFGAQWSQNASCLCQVASFGTRIKGLESCFFVHFCLSFYFFSRWEAAAELPPDLGLCSQRNS